MKDRHVLVDTSAWIFALRKDFIPSIKNKIEVLLRNDLVLTTGIIKLELLGGTKNEKEFQRLKSSLDSLDYVPIDEIQWTKAYEIAFDLRRKGVTIPSTDILIAACALTADAVVVHADAHFDLIARHVGLKTESFMDHIKR
jgi:predicted nucleic acid-binding protein